MLTVCYLSESRTEEDIDRYIQFYSSQPFIRQFTITSIEFRSHDTYYLKFSGGGGWYFGPRGDTYWKWFGFMTEDGKVHKFDVSTDDKARDIAEKFVRWIESGYVVDGTELETFDDDDLLDI